MDDGHASWLVILINYVIIIIIPLVCIFWFKKQVFGPREEHNYNGGNKVNKTYSLFIQVMGTKELSSQIFSYCSYSFIEIAMVSRCNKLCNSFVSAGILFSPFLSIKRVVSVNHLLWITKRAKSVLFIDFSIIPTTDDVLLNVAKSCHEHLRHTIFAQNKIITDLGLYNLASHCHCIQVLIIPGTNITDQALKNCAKFLSNLRHLDVSNCDNIGDEGLTDLFLECNKLEYIDLSSSKISDNTIKALMLSCRLIKQIILFKCSSLTDLACHHISNTSVAVDILGISVSKCYGLSDAGVMMLAKSLKSLNYLDVSHVETITDRTLIAVAENMTCISVINTSWCKLVTDVGVNTLAAKCSYLRELHIRECYRVSEEAITNIKNTNKCNIAVFDY